jgi:hypothetical protein
MKGLGSATDELNAVPSAPCPRAASQHGGVGTGRTLKANLHRHSVDAYDTYDVYDPR